MSAPGAFRFWSSLGNETSCSIEKGCGGLKAESLLDSLHIADGPEYVAAWRVWSTFHSLTGFHRNTAVALELSPELPSDELLERWLSEPIGALLIPITLFQTTADGELSLPHRHRAFVISAIKHGVSLYSRCESISYYYCCQ